MFVPVGITQEGQESFIGVFVAPEITPEHVAPVSHWRANQDAAIGIVATGSSPFSTSLRFRTGVQKALIYLWCSATPTLVFTIRNTKSSVWYGQSRSFTASPHLKKK